MSAEQLIRYHNASLTLRMIKKLVKHIPKEGPQLLNTAETRVQSFLSQEYPFFDDAAFALVKTNLIKQTIDALHHMDSYIAEIKANADGKPPKELNKVLEYVNSMKALATKLMAEMNEMSIDEAFSHASSVYSYLTNVHLKLLSVKAHVDRLPFHDVCRSVVQYYLETLNPPKKGKTPPRIAPLGAAIAPLGTAPVTKPRAAVFASPAATSLSGLALSGPTAPTPSGVATRAPLASGLKTLHLEGADQVLLSTINENFTRLSEAIGKLKPKTKAAAVGGRLRATRRCLKA